MPVRCGNRKAHQFWNDGEVDHHETSAQVRECFTTEGGIPSLEEEARDAEAASEIWAEEGYVRQLESWGSDETYAERQYDAARGVFW